MPDSQVTPITALDDYPQILFILDSLACYQHHHLWLTTQEGDLMHSALTESLQQLCAAGQCPVILKNADFYFFNKMKKQKTANNHLTIFIIQDNDLESDPVIINQFIQEKTADPTNRFIIFSKNRIKKFIRLHSLKNNFFYKFKEIKLDSLNETQQIHLLKTHRSTLETFHKVILPDGIFITAHHLVKRFPQGNISLLTQAYTLIDSAAARTRHDEQIKSVTPAILTQLFADWTGIPASCLENSTPFHASKVANALRQHIHGQDEAIREIAIFLQNKAFLPASISSMRNQALLLAGPTGCGKNSLVKQLSYYLAGEKFNTILQIYPTDTIKKIKNKFNEKLYPILYIENIEHISAEVLTYLFQKQHNTIYRPLMIMTTTLGTETLQQLATPSISEQKKTFSLMQLVMEAQSNHPVTQTTTRPSIETLRQHIFPTLAAALPAWLLNQLWLVPFVPLDYHSIEKKTREKIKTLIHAIEDHMAIQIMVMPEVYRFMTHATLKHETAHTQHVNSPEFLLNTCLSQQLLAYAEKKIATKQLRIRLDETGEVMVCEPAEEHVFG